MCDAGAKTLTTIRPLECTNDAAVTKSKNEPSVDKKLVALRSILEKDICSADMKWSFFVAACQHYRYDSCLKPFPPKYVKEDQKDIDGLREVLDKTPSLALLSQYLNDPDVYRTSSEIIDLLYWVLAHSKDAILKSIPKNEFKSILNKANCKTPTEPPNYIFQVSCPNREARWAELCAGRRSLFAFHGSRLENFYSIIHHGLQQHMNKNALFGKGIYLSSEISVSLPYSPTGYGWGKSIVGTQLSCIAVCELVDHPDVKCQVKDGRSPKSRAIASDSLAGEVPEKYFVVCNSDLVRVRYLLVYSGHSSLCRTTQQRISVFGWFRQHKLLTFIMGYMVLLAAIGLSHSPIAQRYYRALAGRIS